MNTITTTTTSSTTPETTIIKTNKKKGGRPKGSKNKKKSLKPIVVEKEEDKMAASLDLDAVMDGQIEITTSPTTSPTPSPTASPTILPTKPTTIQREGQFYATLSDEEEAKMLEAAMSWDEFCEKAIAKEEEWISKHGYERAPEASSRMPEGTKRTDNKYLVFKFRKYISARRHAWKPKDEATSPRRECPADDTKTCDCEHFASFGFCGHIPTSCKKVKKAKKPKSKPLFTLAKREAAITAIQRVLRPRIYIMNSIGVYAMGRITRDV